MHMINVLLCELSEAMIVYEEIIKFSTSISTLRLYTMGVFKSGKIVLRCCNYIFNIMRKSAFI